MKSLVSRKVYSESLCIKNFFDSDVTCDIKTITNHTESSYAIRNSHLKQNIQELRAVPYNFCKICFDEFCR